MAKTAINPKRSEDFAKWYQQVILSADLAESSPVRGCMTIKPYGYAIWENIQRIFDQKIKKIGVQNAYFPLLIPLEFLSKEAEHVDGFAKECAVITHHRLKKDDKGALVPDGKLTEPYIIRPTSEAIIGHTISKWIKSYRDLPLKLNQWCNVLRWEMRPRLFLRTSEFLWQEGHTAFETEKEAKDDALKMLDIYYDFITEDLAIPVIKGEKTDEEKFPGAKNTYTVEAMMQDGKSLQAGTSHYLGQGFSKAFNIKFSAQDGNEHYAYTASWGISTRLIGGLVMTHADDDGLILPPPIAPYQVVIIPITFSGKGDPEEIKKYCQNMKERLDSLGLSTFIDFSEDKSSNKIWKWIKRGAPIRIEIGAREVLEKKVLIARRDLAKSDKITLSIESLEKISDILADMNEAIRSKAKKNRDDNIKDVENLDAMEKLFSNGFNGFVSIEKSETDSDKFISICDKYSLSRRCIPFNLNIKNERTKVLVGKSY